MYQIRTSHKARTTNPATAAPISIEEVLPPLELRDSEDKGGGGGECEGVDGFF